MKRSFTKLMAAFALIVFMMPSLVAWGQTRSDVTLNIQSYAQANSWQNGTQYLTATVSPVTFTANGGNNTGKYYTSGNEWRYYQTESASITVSVSSDYTLSSIAFTYNSTNSGVLKDGASTVSSGSTVSVSGTSATFSVGNSGSATNGQVKFTKIVVTYVAVGGNPIVATPTFEPNVGAFLDSQEVSIACATDDATIYYTTNGNDPTTSSSVYSAPFTINATTTVKALAVKTGMDNSEIASAEFVKVTPMSVDDAIAAITAAGSNIPIENQCVTGIVCTASNNIYSGKLSYWISDDGTTTNRLEAYNGLGLYGEAFTSVDDVQVGDVVVVYGDLTKYNSTYEFAAGNYLLSLVRPAIVVETPTFDPNGGTFTAVQSVTISCETPDVTIYYTTDGSDPTNESTLYEGAVTVGESMTLKARAYDNNNNASAIASATFTINLPYSGAPYARINNVSYLTDGAKVIFAARFDDNADKYYAMTATASGKPEGVLFTSTTSNDFEVLPAAIVDAESTYCWTVGVTADGFTFTNADNKTIGYTSSTNFATGGDNTEWTVELGTTGSSAMVPSYEAFNINNKNTPARAFALNSNNNFGPYDINSNNNSGSYNFSIDIFVQGAEPTPTITVAAPTFSKADGTPVTTATFASGFRVIATCETEGATVYYTTDGSTPDINSTLYQPYMANGQDMGGISARYTTTIKAVGYLNGAYSPVSTVTLFVNTADSPYTVTDALAFHEYPTSQIWVRGIVCTAPTQAPTANGQLTYYISVDGEAENRLEVYKGLGLNQAAFTAQDDIKVGDIVTVYGIVSVYNNTTIEFTQGNYLTYFERPVNLNPTITVTPATVEVNADEHDGTLDLTYENLEISDMTDFAIQYYDAEGEEAETPDWIEVSVAEQDPEIGEGYVVSYFMLENEGEARTAYFKVWALGDEDYVYSNLVTINQAEFVIDFVELPFEWAGGTKEDLDTVIGVSGHGLGTNYAESNAPYRIKFDTDGDYILIKTDKRPGVVTLGIKKLGGAGTTSITLEGSSDGVTFTTIETFANEGVQNAELQHVSSVDFGANDRYVRIYFNKPTGGTNVGVGPITIAEYVEPVPAITVESTTISAPYEGVEEGTLNVTYTLIETSLGASIYWYTDNTGTTTTDEPDWLTADINETTLNVDYIIEENNDAARTAYFKVYGLDGEGNDVYSDLVTVTQASAPQEYYLTVEPFENLEIVTFVNDDMVMEEDGTISVTAGALVMLSIVADEGYAIETLMVNGVDHANDIAADFTYSFEMPDEDVTISATAVEVTASTYTLATSIESGKTYIIVGWADGVPYAMGEQRSNNRAGVGITVDGTTATVSSEGVYEFVVASLGEDYYSIYDNETPGYLYAAATGSNYLRTETQLDENHNGDWKITINSETGLASVVADQSSNRNVMQFNNSSTIFSCYSSASQKPVYLYVKNEEPVITPLTQTIELAAGTNWVSFYVDITLADLKTAIQTALPGNTATAIIASKQANVRYMRGRWAGQLNALDPTQMYKITVSDACEIVLEGMPVDPTGLTVTIVPGANWIAYPFATSSTPTNFFSGFAINNDQVSSKTQSSRYRGRWAGQLNTLEPGQGYIYFSAGAEDRFFSYPTLSKDGDKAILNLRKQ